MTGPELSTALQTLGLDTQAAAKWLGVSVRAVQRYRVSGAPGPAARAVAGKLSADEALKCAFRFAQTDGAHHKAWVIDQMVRSLTGDGYAAFVKDYCNGEDGPGTYEWDEGIAP